jgi:hypothetical protein
MLLEKQDRVRQQIKAVRKHKDSLARTAGYREPGRAMCLRCQIGSVLSLSVCARNTDRAGRRVGSSSADEVAAVSDAYTLSLPPPPRSEKRGVRRTRQCYTRLRMSEVERVCARSTWQVSGMQPGRTCLQILRQPEQGCQADAAMLHKTAHVRGGESLCDQAVMEQEPGCRIQARASPGVSDTLTHHHNGGERAARGTLSTTGWTATHPFYTLCRPARPSDVRASTLPQ